MPSAMYEFKERTGDMCHVACVVLVTCLGRSSGNKPTWLSFGEVNIMFWMRMILNEKTQKSITETRLMMMMMMMMETCPRAR